MSELDVEIETGGWYLLVHSLFCLLCFLSRILNASFNHEFSYLTKGMKPGQSDVYDSVQQSTEIRIFQRIAFGCQDYSSGFFSHSHDSNSRSVLLLVVAQVIDLMFD